MRRLTRLVVTSLLLSGLALSAAAQPAPPPHDWRGTGTVVALLTPPSDLHPTRPVIVLRHEPIPGLMDQSMYMPFLVASVELLDGLRVGDRIAFAIKETPDALLIVGIGRLP